MKIDVCCGFCFTNPIGWYELLYSTWGIRGKRRTWSKLDGTRSEAQASQPQMWYCWLDSCNMRELFDCSFTLWSILTCLLLEEEKRFIFLASSSLWSPNYAKFDAVKTDFDWIPVFDCVIFPSCVTENWSNVLFFHFHQMFALSPELNLLDAESVQLYSR